MDILMLNLAFYETESQGALSFFESTKEIPFEIKRIYYVYDVPQNIKRGRHAHKKLKQLLWCPYGEIEIMVDDGEEKKTYLLDRPEKALLMMKGYWRDVTWNKCNSVLCVAASDYYDEQDYIRDYNEFMQYVKEGYWDESRV